MAWRIAKSHCLLTGANSCIWADEDCPVAEADQRMAAIIQERAAHYETKLLEHATVLCTL